MKIVITKQTDYKGSFWSLTSEDFENSTGGYSIGPTSTFIDYVLSKILKKSVSTSPEALTSIEIRAFGRCSDVTRPEVIDTPEKLKEYLVACVNAVLDVPETEESVTFEI